MSPHWMSTVANPFIQLCGISLYRFWNDVQCFEWYVSQ